MTVRQQRHVPLILTQKERPGTPRKGAGLVYFFPHRPA